MLKADNLSGLANYTTARSNLGLGNVDNTSDTAKPVSTAQATADGVVQAYAIQRANHTGTQAATTVSVSPTGNLAATTTQAALVELQGDIDTINTALG